VNPALQFMPPPDAPTGGWECARALTSCGPTGPRAPAQGPDGRSLAIWRSVATLTAMDDKNKPNQNEGEGSKSADKKYRDAATDFAKRTDTVKAGLDAEREVEQRKGEFDKAEQTGRSHSKGELPDDVSGNDFDKR